MKKFLCFAAAATLFAATFIGCSSTQQDELGRFTIISSKNIDFSRIAQMQRSSEKIETKKLNAKGILVKDQKLSENYALENALDSALEQIPGAVAMIDAKVEYFRFKGLGREKWGYKFEGTALIDPSLIGENTAIPEDENIYFISNETTGKVTLLSEDEYNNLVASIKG